MPVVNKAHIYNPPTNKTAQQFVDADYKLIVGAFNASLLDDILNGGYMGQFAFTSGKYRVSDPPTSLHPTGQANLPVDTPEDVTANYQHNNIGFDGEVVDLRDESKLNNFILDPTATLVLRNSKMAMGYPMSASIRALYAAYASRVINDERPDIPWDAHFHDDENVNQFFIYQVGAVPNNRYTPNDNAQYFADTLSWAIYRRDLTEAEDLEYITNVQGTNLTRYFQFVDALCDDALFPVTIMNEFAFTGQSNAREWAGWDTFDRYRQIIDYVTAKPLGKSLVVLHTDPFSDLYTALVCAFLISVRDFSKALLRSGEDYNIAVEPDLLNTVEELGDPLELAAPIAVGSHTYRRRFENGTVTLNGDTGQYSIELGEVIIDPEEGDGELPTLEEITAEVLEAAAPEIAAHKAFLDAFLEAHKEEIVAGLVAVYKPEVYDVLWLVCIPELIAILESYGYAAFRVSVDNYVGTLPYYNIGISK